MQKLVNFDAELEQRIFRTLMVCGARREVSGDLGPLWVKVWNIIAQLLNQSRVKAQLFTLTR